MKIDEIEVDEDIYPRVQKSPSVIKEYAEALLAGELFPPITVQKILDKGKKKVISLDGYHRIKGIEEHNKIVKANEQIPNDKVIEEVEITYYKNEILDREEHLVELMIVSAELNIRHGLKLKHVDVKSQLVKIANIDPDPSRTWASIAKSFGVTDNFVSDCVAPIRRRYYFNKFAEQYQLNRFLGWKQGEIGDVYGVTQHAISQNISKLRSDESLIFSAYWNEHKKPKDITEYFNINYPLFWTIILKDKDDPERLNLFYPGDEEKEKGSSAPCYYNDWHYYIPDERMGMSIDKKGVKIEGRIPGQIVLSTLFFYTEQGDWVIDPMAGGGTTLDACLVMNRKCQLFDNNPRRDYIIKNDIMEGIPSEWIKSYKLVFLDPPYGDMAFPELYPNGVEQFYDFMGTVAEESYNIIEDKGIVALLMGDKTGDDRWCLTGECYKIFTEQGFECIDKIAVSHSPAICDAQDVIWAKKNKRMLGVHRDLYIFRK